MSTSDQSLLGEGFALIPAERIESRIFLIRGEKVILDVDLAELYGVTTSALNQAIKRNGDRFPADFMFQLSADESELVLKSQIVISNSDSESKSLSEKGLLKSQVVTSKRSGAGGRRYRPYAFTEQGVAMLSGVLRSERAVQVNIAIVRTFVRLRQLMTTHADLARKLAELENRYDDQFKAVFDAIRELMSPALPRGKKEMGFHTGIPALRPAKKSKKPAKA